MNLQQLIRSFAGGEITPEMYGRMDLDKFQTGAALLSNFIPLPYGAAHKRPGFAYVNQGGDTSKKIRVIPFSYNADQTMVLEFGDQYIRFHTAGGTLLETAKNITGITQPAGVVTSNAHGYSNGEWVYLSGIGGMTELNGRFVVVSDAAANTFRMKDFAGNYITTGDYGAYTSGGTVARVYEIASPYLETHLFDLHYTQNADVLTIVHPSYAPRELSRLGAINWTLSNISFTSQVEPPTAVAAAATVGTGAKEYLYAVSSLSEDGTDESLVQNQAVGAAVNITDAFVAVLPLINKAEGFFDVATTAGLRAGQFIGPVTGVVGMTGVNDKSYKIESVVSGTRLRVRRANGARITTAVWGGAYVSGGQFYKDAVLNDLATSGNYNTVSWTPPGDQKLRYRVYKRDFASSMYGFIGETESTEFKDDNITPDLSRTPPVNIDVFDNEDEYPAAVTYFEQRRGFAGTNEAPQSVWLTRSGTEAIMTQSFPPTDSDAFGFRIASRQNNQIRHLAALYDLFALTAGGEFRLSSSSGDDPISAATVNPRPLAYVGCNNVQPAETQSSILFAAAVGGHLFELAPAGDMARQYTVSDMSLLAPHLVDGYDIVDMAFQRAPVPILWCVRSDGVLLSFTYVPAQRVLAWARHTTIGEFESVCCVKEGAEDRLYAVVKRDIDGADVRHIERMAPLRTPSNTGSFYVDSGLTYDGAATTTISGLWHLEGEEVAVLADGADHPRRTVVDGQIELDEEASVVHVGLPYSARLKTLPLALESAPAAGVTTHRNVEKVWLRLHDSRGVFVGFSFDDLYENKERTTEPYGSPPELQSEMVEIAISGDWNLDAAVCVESSAPLPCTILAIVIDVAV